MVVCWPGRVRRADPERNHASNHQTLDTPTLPAHIHNQQLPSGHLGRRMPSLFAGHSTHNNDHLQMLANQTCLVSKKEFTGRVYFQPQFLHSHKNTRLFDRLCCFAHPYAATLALEAATWEESVSLLFVHHRQRVGSRMYFYEQLP